MCNSPTVNQADVINWFTAMRDKGFKIKQIGHDRKFCREYFLGMKAAHFAVIDQPQYFYKNQRASGTSKRVQKRGSLLFALRGF